MTKAGQVRFYESHLLRRTYREDGKVKHETLANVTALPDEQLDLLRRSFKGEKFVPADTLPVTVERSLPWRWWWPRPVPWAFPVCSGRPAGSAIWRWR